MAFESESFNGTQEYFAERAEDIAQLGIFAIAALAFLGLIVGSGKGVQAVGRSVGGGGRRVPVTA